MKEVQGMVKTIYRRVPNRLKCPTVKCRTGGGGGGGGVDG